MCPCSAHQEWKENHRFRTEGRLSEFHWGRSTLVNSRWDVYFIQYILAMMCNNFLYAFVSHSQFHYIAIVTLTGVRVSEQFVSLNCNDAVICVWMRLHWRQCLLSYIRVAAWRYISTEQKLFKTKLRRFLIDIYLFCFRGSDTCYQSKFVSWSYLDRWFITYRFWQLFFHSCFHQNVKT